jgi:phage terminase small subunit
LPTLKDSRKEAFALALAKGSTNIEAYEQLFPGERKKSSLFVNASRYANRPEILNRVAEIKTQFTASTTITAQRVLEEMAKLAFSNYGDFVKLDENGDPYVDLNDISKEQMAAISEISITEHKGSRPSVKIKLHDKRAALNDLGKHFGLFRDKLEVSGPNGGPIETSNAIEVSLLAKDERDMLRQLLLIAAQRKAEKEMNVIEHEEGDSI